MLMLLGCVTYTWVSSLLLEINLLNMAQQLPAAVGASCLHLWYQGMVFPSILAPAPLEATVSAFVLCVWRNTSGSLLAIYFYHFFCCLAAFSLDTTTTYMGPSCLRSFALRGIPPSSEGSYASQLTASTSAI